MPPFTLFHPSWLRSSFLKLVLNVTLLIKTLLFSQAELTTPLMAPTAISDHHMICVYCNDKPLLCVSPPSSCTEAEMGTQKMLLEQRQQHNGGNQNISSWKKKQLSRNKMMTTAEFWSNESHFLGKKIQFCVQMPFFLYKRFLK